jgi:signal peptidase II
MSPTLSRSTPSTGAIVLRFVSVLLVALTLDLASKAWAVTELANGGIVLADRFSLLLAFNTGIAGGASIGPLTWPINVIGTMAAIVLVSSVVLPLARVDRRASLAMGLVAGGASGNLTSLLTEPRGVPDFLAARLQDSILVFNVADIALWLGAGILVPITLGLVRTIRAQQVSERPEGTVAEAARTA